MGQLTFQATLGGAVNLAGPNTAATTTFTLPAADGTSGQVLQTNGSGTLSFAGVSLTTGVTGTLPIANGGTNSTATATAGGVGYGTGTAHAYTAAGTAGQVLLSNGASAPTWGAVSAGYTVTTPVAATGTSVIISGIPTTATQVIVNFNDIRWDTADSVQLRIGTTGGIATSGYVSTTMYPNSQFTNDSTSFLIYNNSRNADFCGSFCLNLQDATNNIWVGGGITANQASGTQLQVSTGRKALTGDLSQIEIKSLNSYNMNQGFISIMYI